MEVLTRILRRSRPGRSAAVLAALALLVASCTEKPTAPDEHDPVTGDDLPPTPVNLRLSVAPNAVTLDWDVADGTGVTQYRIYRSADSGPFRWLAATSALTYVDAQVVTGITYRYQVSAIKGGLEGARSATVTAVPDAFGIVLEGGAQVTAANSVAPGSYKIVVGLVAPENTVSFRLSEDPALAGAAVQTFQSTAPSAIFTLSRGDGSKTVYAQFVAPGGAVSETVSASILLDTKAVILLVTEDSADQVLLVDDQLHITVSVDTTGGSVQADVGDQVLGLELFDDGTNGDPVAFDGVYERDFTVTAGVEVVEGVVRASFTDAVGNQADQRTSATKVTIADPPAPVSFDTMATTVTGASIRLAWSRNLDADFSEYRILRALGGSVTPLAPVIATIPGQGTQSYTDAGLQDGATYTWGIVVVDDNGFQSPLATLTDTVGSDPEIASPSLTPDVGTQATSFQWDCTYRHPAGSPPVEVRVVVDGVFVLPMTNVSGGTDWVGGEDFRVNANLAPGPHTHYYEAVAADGSRTRNPEQETSQFTGPLVTG